MVCNTSRLATILLLAVGVAVLPVQAQDDYGPAPVLPIPGVGLHPAPVPGMPHVLAQTHTPYGPAPVLPIPGVGLHPAPVPGMPHVLAPMPPPSIERITVTARRQVGMAVFDLADCAECLACGVCVDLHNAFGSESSTGVVQDRNENFMFMIEPPVYIEAGGLANPRPGFYDAAVQSFLERTSYATDVVRAQTIVGTKGEVRTLLSSPSDAAASALYGIPLGGTFVVEPSRQARQNLDHIDVIGSWPNVRSMINELRDELREQIKDGAMP